MIRMIIWWFKYQSQDFLSIERWTISIVISLLMIAGPECGFQQPRRWHVFVRWSAFGASRRWISFQLASLPLARHSSLWICTAQCYNRLAGCSSRRNSTQRRCFLFEVSCFVRSWRTFAGSSWSDAGIIVLSLAHLNFSEWIITTLFLFVGDCSD